QVQRTVGRLRRTNRRQSADSFAACGDGFRLRAADGADEQADEPERRDRFYVLQSTAVLQFLPPDQGGRWPWQAPAGAGPGTGVRAAARKTQSRLSRVDLSTVAAHLLTQAVFSNRGER